MDTLTVTRREAVSPAYCSCCRGVLPFRTARQGAFARETLECTRCGTLFRRFDPAAEGRRRALRYLVYAGMSGMILAALALGFAALGPASSPVSTADTIAMWLLGGLTVGCIARSFKLMMTASDYESLEPYEVRELDRRLCPGMIREDVVAELSRIGWRPAKIRAVIAGMRPAAG